MVTTRKKLTASILLTGNKEAREGTARFLCRQNAECSHFIFSNTVCVTTLVYYTAYLAPLALFPCRGVSRRTDKRTVCNRSFDRASWTTSLKTSFSDGPGCRDPEAQLLLSSSRRSETCGTEETGINEVSLSGACFLQNSVADISHLPCSTCSEIDFDSSKLKRNWVYVFISVWVFDNPNIVTFKAYSLMSNRGRSQNFQNLIFFFCIFL